MSELPIAAYCQDCGSRGPCGCPYRSIVEYHASQHGLDPNRIMRQIDAESSFRPQAVSPVGAKGLMQFMPATWGEWGEGDPFDPEASIRAGCRYMAFLVGRFAEIPDELERYRFALASYNAGRGHINTMLGHARKACGLPQNYHSWDRGGRKGGKWQTWAFASQYLHLATGKHAHETLGYVQKIMGRE